MSDTIKDLFMGKIRPFENCSIHTKEYETLKNQLFEERQILLSSVDKSQLEKYDNLLAELNFFYQEEFFYRGFKLRVKLLMEALS